MRIRRLVMLRHGQTEWNAGSRMQGQIDTDLTDLGRQQADAAAELLAKRQPLLIVSSDLRRALEVLPAEEEAEFTPECVGTQKTSNNNREHGQAQGTDCEHSHQLQTPCSPGGNRQGHAGNQQAQAGGTQCTL